MVREHGGREQEASREFVVANLMNATTVELRLVLFGGCVQCITVALLCLPVAYGLRIPRVLGYKEVMLLCGPCADTGWLLDRTSSARIGT